MTILSFVVNESMIVYIELTKIIGLTIGKVIFQKVSHALFLRVDYIIDGSRGEFR